MSAPIIADISSSVSDTATAINAVPVGTIVAYPTINLPEGWLPCDGRQISQAQFPNLFALIGATVPDLRSRFIIGAGQGPGLGSYGMRTTGGEERHKLDASEMPAHSHNMGIGGGNRSASPGPGNSEGYTSNNTVYVAYTTTAGGDQPHNNIPPYYALIYMIKY